MLKWTNEDRVGLLLAAGLGALIGLPNGSGDVGSNILWPLVGAGAAAGLFYCYRAFR